MPDIFVPKKPKPNSDTEQFKAPSESTVNAPEPREESTEAAVPAPTGHPGFNTFCTFAHNPQGLTFAEQKENERIVVFLRRHFVTNVPWMIISLLLLIVPFLVTFVLQTSGFSFAFLPTRFLIILGMFYYLIVFGYAFANFTSWFYNISMITQERVVDVDFTNLSQVNVGTTKLDDIENVEFTQPGFFAGFFNYGTVVAKSIAGEDHFAFTRVPKPARIADILGEIIGKKEKKV
jgi:hypothetical protein